MTVGVEQKKNLPVVEKLRYLASLKGQECFFWF